MRSIWYSRNWPRDRCLILNKSSETRSILNKSCDRCKRKNWSNPSNTQQIGDAINIWYSTNCRRHDWYSILLDRGQTPWRWTAYSTNPVWDRYITDGDGIDTMQEVEKNGCKWSKLWKIFGGDSYSVARSFERMVFKRQDLKSCESRWLFRVHGFRLLCIQRGHSSCINPRRDHYPILKESLEMWLISDTQRIGDVIDIQYTINFWYSTVLREVQAEALVRSIFDTQWIIVVDALGIWYSIDGDAVDVWYSTTVLRVEALIKSTWSQDAINFWYSTILGDNPLRKSSEQLETWSAPW